MAEVSTTQHWTMIYLNFCLLTNICYQ